MAVEEIKRSNGMKMKCLRSIFGVTLMDRVRNKEVRRRTDVTRVLAG